MYTEKSMNPATAESCVACLVWKSPTLDMNTIQTCESRTLNLNVRFGSDLRIKEYAATAVT